MSDYFISDLHLGHRRMAQQRGFSDTDAMDNFLISRWNSRIREEDRVFVVGDLSFRSPHGEEIGFYLSRMRGKKILIRGNHDKEWMSRTPKEETAKYFVRVEDLLSVKVRRNQSEQEKMVRVVLCHYPMLEWEECRYHHDKDPDLYPPRYLLHGHIHDSRKPAAFAVLRDYLPDALNCAADLPGADFQPRTLDEWIEINRKWYGRE